MRYDCQFGYSEAVVEVTSCDVLGALSFFKVYGFSRMNSDLQYDIMVISKLNTPTVRSYTVRCGCDVIAMVVCE